MQRVCVAGYGKDGIDIDVPAHWIEKFCAEYGDAREAAGYARGVAEERERCAAICDRMGNPLNVKYEGGGCRKAAAAIRAAQKGIE